ncbi:MAG: hypothetical protein ABIS18_04120, partial [Actinomycetota bacterium]
MTTMVALSSTGGALLASAVAVFSNLPSVALVVSLCTVTLAEVLEAKFPNAQVSVCEVPELIEQSAPAGSVLAMIQLIPAPEGNGSFNVTFSAVPGPPLLTVITNPIGSTSLISSLIAVFTTLRLGGKTTMVAEASEVGALSDFTVTVLLKVPAVDPVVADTTCTDAVAPTAKSPNEQV